MDHPDSPVNCMGVPIQLTGRLVVWCALQTRSLFGSSGLQTPQPRVIRPILAVHWVLPRAGEWMRRPARAPRAGSVAS